MADGVTVKITGDRELVALLTNATLVAAPEARKLVSKGALNMKRDWRRTWSDIAHAPFVSLAISYDVTGGTRAGGWVEAEIGPEDNADRQGFLGRIFELGGLHSPPMPGGLPALEAEAPRTEAALIALGERLLT
jgi:hypothetical protein